MIQRIQSLFLFISVIILVIASFWRNFFEFVTTTGVYHFNGHGVFKQSVEGGELERIVSFPLYMVLILLAAFTLYIILLYKNLKKQLAYIKILWGIYIMVLFGIVFWRYFFASGQVTGDVLNHYFSYDFYLLVIGLPFVQMGMTYIAKDKKKIESIDRIR